MPKGYRTYLPEQELLLPPSLREWLPEDHLVYFVSEVIDQLDLSAIHAVYGEENRGQPPYDPRLMTKLLVYGYCTGVFSSRRIEFAALWRWAAFCRCVNGCTLSGCRPREARVRSEEHTSELQ